MWRAERPANTGKLNHEPTTLTSANASNLLRNWQAHKAVAEPRQLYPTHVSNLKDVLGPYRQAEDLAGREEGLRKAGLPD
jgi:hypothetical protein